MPLILHLSDLHLGNPSEVHVLGDYKSDSVPLGERESRLRDMEATLFALGEYLIAAKRDLDAIVISGDITLGASEDGFQRLLSMLSKLGTACPPPGKVAIVPGNHDVHWFTPPSTRDRYSLFLSYVRDRGYVTPPLDGVDFPEPSDPPFSDLLRHAIVDSEHRWAIVPMNSSNYSGSLEAFPDVDESRWKQWASTLDDGDPKQTAQQAFKKMRTRDMPRISPRHFDLVGRLLKGLDEKAAAAQTKLTKIVAFHHHVLPVSAIEENKAFESFANLGRLRHFLKDRGVHVVLHGHKHTQQVYTDRGDGHGTLVISAGAMGFGGNRNEAFRLVDLKVERRHAPVVSLQSVPVIHTGASLQTGTPTHFPLWELGQPLTSDATKMTLISGDTVNEVYDRIQATFETSVTGTTRHLVVTQVEHPSHHIALPDHYPSLPGISDRQKWFSDLVAWWQLESSRLGAFTHGCRVYNYGGDINQLDRVVEVLKNPSNASRAVITLLDPRVDDVSLRLRLPAFCSAQFFLRGGSEPRHLDVLGFFRHQEMRYWWPINVAELGKIQDEVCQRLSSHHVHLKAGRIITVAAVAKVGDAVPFVAVPEIDRLLDVDERDLWNMAYALVWPAMPQRAAQLERWISLLSEMKPAPSSNPGDAPVAVHGLKYLLSTLKRFEDHHSAPPLTRALELLEQLVECNEAHASRLANAQVSRQQHDIWKRKVIETIDKMRPVIEQLFE